MQLLRDEVETLKNVLNSPIRRHHWVREGLHGMRKAIEAGLDTAVADGLKAGQYIAEIGRILPDATAGSVRPRVSTEALAPGRQQYLFTPASAAA